MGRRFLSRSLPASLVLAALAWSGLAWADGPRCSSWRKTEKPNELISLRSCRGAEEGGAAGTYTVELRNGYGEPSAIRYEIVTADGTAVTRSATIAPGDSHAGMCAECAEHGGVASFRVVERQTGAAAAATKEALRRVKSTRYIDVRARDLRLGASSMDRLERIAERYFRATKRRLVVTGGMRTTRRQAELMYAKLAHGDDIVTLYEQRAAAIEIRDAYRAGVAEKKKRAALVRVIHDRIDAQVARGVYVSRHLQSGAADVRSRDMTAPQEKALRDAIAAEPGAALLDERKGVEPHFHLTL